MALALRSDLAPSPRARQRCLPLSKNGTFARPRDCTKKSPLPRWERARVRVKGAGCGGSSASYANVSKERRKTERHSRFAGCVHVCYYGHMNISGHDTLAFLPPPRRRILGGCPSPHPARACSICVPKYPKQVPFVFRWCPQNGPRITPAQLRNGTEWNKTEHIFPKPAWKSPFCTGWSGPTASIRDGERGHSQSVSAGFGRLPCFRIRSSATERPHLTGWGGHADAALAGTSARGYLDCPIPRRVTGQYRQCPASS